MSKTSSKTFFPRATTNLPDAPEDPYYLEPIPGTSQEALRRDRLIHLLLMGLRVVTKGGGQETFESNEREGEHCIITERDLSEHAGQVCFALAGVLEED